MRRADDGLRALLRKHLPPPCHVTTLETSGVTSGVPDCHVQAPAGGVWVECKATRGPGRVVLLRPSQIGWLSRHCRHGGHAVVAVRSRLTRPAGRRSPAANYDELWLYDARVATVRGVVSLPRPDADALWTHFSGLEEPLGCWYGGPAQWNWTEVLAALLSVADA